jgi:hypothetical protein
MELNDSNHNSLATFLLRSNKAHSPSKIQITTQKTMSIFESTSFTKLSWAVHPTILPFIAAMTVKGKKAKVIRAHVAPINHCVLNEAKAINIAHTMMGNLCHGNESKVCRWNRWVIILV